MPSSHNCWPFRYAMVVICWILSVNACVPGLRVRKQRLYPLRSSLSQSTRIRVAALVTRVLIYALLIHRHRGQARSHSWIAVYQILKKTLSL